MNFRELLVIAALLPASHVVSSEPAPRTIVADRQDGTITGPGCEDGLVLDDGSAETAYGWVPSAVWGEYVQTFPINPLMSSRLDSVCVCWTRTQADDDIDFEIVVYSGSPGSPASRELFSVPTFHSGPTAPSSKSTFHPRLRSWARAPTTSVSGGTHRPINTSFSAPTRAPGEPPSAVSFATTGPTVSGVRSSTRATRSSPTTTQ